MGLPASRRTARDRRGRRLPEVPGIRVERRFWDLDRVVVGVDEVGRGAWAGPVTFGAVVLPRDRRMYKLRDSKQLDPARREQLAERLAGFAEAVGVGHASNDEIDRLGMSDAMRLAATRALDALPVEPDVVLLDGSWDLLSHHPAPVVTIVHGDAHSASIAAASIVAKVDRDARLRRAASDHPAYGFADNKGYPTPAHLAALDQVGPCVLHRHSWAPIRALTGADEDAGEGRHRDGPAGAEASRRVPA